LVLLTGIAAAVAISVRDSPSTNYTRAQLPLAVLTLVAVLGVLRTHYHSIRAGSAPGGRASLEARTVGQFVPRWLRIAPFVAVATMLAATWLYLHLVDQPLAGAPSAYWVAGVAIVAVALLAIGDITLRSVLLAPLPADPPELARVEVLIRAVAMRRIVGAEIAAIIYALAFVAGASELTKGHPPGFGESLVVLYGICVSFLTGQFMRRPRVPMLGEPNVGTVAG